MKARFSFVKITLVIIAYILPIIIIATISLVIYWYTNFDTIMSCSGGVIAIITFYQAFSKKIYTFLEDKYYWNIDRLQPKDSDTLKRIKAFWVDDTIKKIKKIKKDKEDKNNKNDLAEIKDWCKKTFKSINVSTNVPIDDQLDRYNVLIFDIDGVSQAGNENDAFNILATQFKRNPFRIFIILTGHHRISKASTETFGFHLYAKGDNVTTSIETDIKKYLNPKWLWDNKIYSVLIKHVPRDIIDNKKIKHINKLFIKDWYKIGETKNINKENLLLWQLAQQEHDKGETQLSDYLKYLCNFIML